MKVENGTTNTGKREVVGPADGARAGEGGRDIGVGDAPLAIDPAASGAGDLGAAASEDADADRARIEQVVVNRRHFYAYSGDLYPSVTTILQAYPKPALMNWAVKVTSEYAISQRRKLWAVAEADEESAIEMLKAVRWSAGKEARELGSGVHAVIATGGKPTEAEKPYLASWHGWLSEMGGKVIDSEFRVVSTKGRYGGTVDLVADCGGFGRLLLDIKTGSGVYDEHHLQVAAYLGADVGLPPDVTGCGVVHVTAEGATLHLSSDPKGLLETFLAVRQVAEYAGMLKEPEGEF